MQSKTVILKSILIYEGLSSGHSFRGKIKHVHNGGVRVIQLKDFEENYTIIGNNCVLVDSEKIKAKNHLKEGDILFTSKGANNFAVPYKEIDRTPTIASSALFVLKIDENLANPDFIAWYINQSKAQNYFKSNESGTYTTSINKTVLEETPIELPSLEKQAKIAKIAQLQNRNLIISNQLIELNKKLTTTQLINSL
jgi:restriction endonuclease S subunit